MGLLPKRLTLSTVLFGDSITEGETWSFWFSRANGGTGGNYSKVANAGVGGNTTAGMLARITADVLDYSPQVVTVLGGTNDTGQGISTATITANLSDIYDDLEAAGAAIVACTIPPRTGLDSGEDTVLLAVNDWIRANYTSWSNAYLCDFNPAMTTDGNEGANNPDTDLFSDGIHPDTDGGKVMADVLAPVLRQVADDLL